MTHYATGDHCLISSVHLIFGPFWGVLECRKWGCNKQGLKGCLVALPGNRPFSPFFLPFRRFQEGAKSTWEIQKTEVKGLFPQISSDLLKPHSLKSPFTAFQVFSDFFNYPGWLWNRTGTGNRNCRNRFSRNRKRNRNRRNRFPGTETGTGTVLSC